MFTALFAILFPVEEWVKQIPQTTMSITICILMFAVGIIFGIKLKVYLEQRTKDREGAKQIAEIRNMISTHKKSLYQENVSSYEELLDTLKEVK